MPDTQAPGTNCNIGVLTTESVLAHWDEVAPFISAALIYGETPLSEIKAGIEANKILAIQVLEGERLVAILTVEIVNTQLRGQMKRMLNSITCTGYAIEQSKEPVVDFLTDLARAEGCDGLMLKGRNGWGKRLKPLGYKVAYTVLTRVL